MYVIGIDPGVTRTGVVVLEDGVLADFATFSSVGEHRSESDYSRATGLGYLVSAWLEDVLEVTDDLRMAIEHPVLGRNASNLMLQMRVMQSIIAWVASSFPDFSVLEVNPKTVKRVTTDNGNATKDDMVAASSFANDTELPIEDREALADAEAIAKCSLILPPVGTLYRVNDDFIAATTNLVGSARHLDTEPSA